MRLSAKGLNLIKSYEGLRLTAYKAIPTVPHYAIGYGHYGPDVRAGMSITEAEATQILSRDVARFENAVNALQPSLPFTLNQNQFDALVSFAYNLGPSRLNDFKGKNAAIIANEIPLYCNAGGRKLVGLLRRRNEERDLFLSESSAPTPAPAPGKSVSQLASEVIAGKWGCGADRRSKLTAAGYDYNAVQAEVNRRMKK